MQIQKTLFKFSTLTALLFTGLCASDDFAHFQAKQQQNFHQQKEYISYKKSLTNEFLNYKKAQQKAYQEYKNALSKYWDKPELSTKTTLLHYTQDKKTKTKIDFKNQVLKIETIAKDEAEAKQKLTQAFVMASSMDTKELFKKDELLQKLASIPTPRNVVKSDIDAKPILQNVLFSKKPTQKELLSYAKKKVQHTTISKRVNKHKKHIYTLNVSLPKDSTIQRSRSYLQEVQKASQKEAVPLSLIFAVIHSESSFNPYARSYVPAYGLMQIVPKTAGIDAYYYLYRKKRLVDASYLYNSQNNIKMGSAYLHILYYKYLKSIKNPTSRLYCTIAAYNTGAGNVARAFGNTNSVSSAARKINTMSSEEVYRHLRKNLRYKEARDYLTKVEKRRRMYAKIYGS
jgi:membrane-bound lytic murein transglycosylase C